MRQSVRSSRMAKMLSGAVLGASIMVFVGQLPASAITSYRIPAVTSVADTGMAPVADTASTTPSYVVVSGAGGVVAATANPTGPGYWTVTSSGLVTAEDGATFYGDTYSDGITGLSGSHPLNEPIVGIAATSNGEGYWLVAADGGVFTFGNATFYGNPYTQGLTGLSGAHPLNAPIIGMSASPDGGGYRLIGSDGGVFDFGNATFYGSIYSDGLTGLSGPHPLNAPIIGIVPDLSGGGYRLIAKDGGVFDFGNATFYGSTYTLGYTGLGGSNPLPAPIMDIMPDPGVSGYYVLCQNGQIFAIGAAAALPADSTPDAVALILVTPSSPPSTPPSAQVPIDTTTSSNWAGVIDTGSGVTSVSGTFTIPTLSSTQSSTCESDNTVGDESCVMAEWVGVDGYGDGNYLIQSGIDVIPEWASSSDATSDFAKVVIPWYEVITPSDAAPQTTYLPIVPWQGGDSVTVTIARTSAGTWSTDVTDNTQNQSYMESGISFSASAASSESAEWIAETPEMSNDVSSLMPNISSGGNFTSRALTIGDVTNSLASSRNCSYAPSGYVCPTTTSDTTAPTSYGSTYNLNAFSFDWGDPL